jgi:hypothetical protein
MIGTGLAITYTKTNTNRYIDQSYTNTDTYTCSRDLDPISSSDSSEIAGKKLVMEIRKNDRS